MKNQTALNAARHRKKMSLNDLAFTVIIFAVLAVTVVIALYPLLFVLSASVSDPKEVAAGNLILLPKGFTLEGYEYILQYDDIFSGYANTILYTVGGTVLNLLVTLPCAYALSRKDLPGRGPLMKIFIVTMYFSGGLIALYLWVSELGMIDTRWAVLLPTAISTYNMIVLRGVYGIQRKSISGTYATGSHSNGTCTTIRDWICYNKSMGKRRYKTD